MFLTAKSRRRPVLSITLAAATALAASPLAQAASGPPTGRVDNVYNGAIYYSTALPTISGWAADPDDPVSPISVRVNVTWTKKACSRFLGCTTSVVAAYTLTEPAQRIRTDIPAGWGPNHGFTAPIPPAPVPVGSYDAEQACITALNVGPVQADDTSLGCYPLAYQQLY